MSDTKPIDDGGPAFPAEGPSQGQFEHPGMTLRDWLAGKTLAGMLANPDWSNNDTNAPNKERSALTQVSYDTADAMIAERKRGGK